MGRERQIARRFQSCSVPPSMLISDTHKIKSTSHSLFSVRCTCSRSISGLEAELTWAEDKEEGTNMLWSTYCLQNIILGVLLTLSYFTFKNFCERVTTVRCQNVKNRIVGEKWGKLKLASKAASLCKTPACSCFACAVPSSRNGPRPDFAWQASSHHLAQ